MKVLSNRRIFMDTVAPNYSERLKELSTMLKKINAGEMSGDLVEDISKEITELEKRLEAKPNLPTSPQLLELDDKIAYFQDKLDEVVRNYETSYETTRKILSEKQSKMDTMHLPSEEELNEFRSKYAERLLKENEYSIFLRNLIEVIRKTIELLHKKRQELVSTMQEKNDKDSEEEKTSSSLDDINSLYNVVPIAFSDGSREISISQQKLKSITASSSDLPQKISTPSTPVNYLPGEAPKDMMEDVPLRKKEPSDIRCFSSFSEELSQGKYSYNIVHATDGEIVDAKSLLEFLTGKRVSDIDQMLEEYSVEDKVASDEVNDDKGKRL